MNEQEWAEFARETGIKANGRLGWLVKWLANQTFRVNLKTAKRSHRDYSVHALRVHALELTIQGNIKTEEKLKW